MYLNREPPSHCLYTENCKSRKFSATKRYGCIEGKGLLVGQWEPLQRSTQVLPSPIKLKLITDSLPSLPWDWQIFEKISQKVTHSGGGLLRKLAHGGSSSLVFPGSSGVTRWLTEPVNFHCFNNPYTVQCWRLFSNFTPMFIHLNSNRLRRRYSIGPIRKVGPPLFAFEVVWYCSNTKLIIC